MDVLKAGERIERINDGLRVIRAPGHLPFGSDALLLAGFLPGGRTLAAELGAGTGAVSLLAAARGKCSRIDGFELQESAADIFARNSALNGLSDRVRAVCADLRTLPSTLAGRYDCVFSNPPYMKTGAGKRSPAAARETARHETAGDIFDFAACAARLLKTGGEAVFVYRPDRAVDLFLALRGAGIEPKRALTVCADPAHAPSVLLVSAKKGARPGLYCPPVFFLKTAGAENTADYEFLLEKGVFPDVFLRP